jgi:ABC-2 type transport system ATP-binding protein
LRERIGGDVVTLTCNDESALEQAAALIQEKFGLNPQRVGDTLRLERHRAHQFVPELIEALPGMIASVSVGKPTLEDVFVRLTGRSFNAEVIPLQAKPSGKHPGRS